MEFITRCRKCGKKMKSERVDDYRVKLVCACGFWEYKTMPSASKAINPYYPSDAFSHVKISEEGERVDDYRVKLVCACGFWEYKTMPSASKAINPYYPSDAFSHVKISEEG